MKVSFSSLLKMMHGMLPDPFSSLVPEPDSDDPGRSSYLAAPAKERGRTSLNPTEELHLMSSAQRESSLAYLFEVTTDALRGSNPRAEADLLHIATSKDPASGVARQIHNNFFILFEMFHTDDPVEFARLVHSYMGRVYDKIASLLREGPDRFKMVTNYVHQISFGPNRLIEQMFSKKFAEQIEEGGHDILMVRDGAMAKMAEISMFGIESDLRRAWTQEKIEKMFSMHILAQTSTKVYARLIKVTVRQMLMAMMAGIDYEVDIDRNLHYREGLDLDKVDLLLGVTVGNAIRAHGSAGQGGRFIKIRWDEERYSLIIEVNSRSVGSRSMEERIEGLNWMLEFISRKGKGITFVIRPRPGDIYHEDSQGPGGEGGGGQGRSGRYSSGDISQYTRPRAMANISMMGALAVRGLMPAVPVWTAGLAANVASPAFGIV